MSADRDAVNVGDGRVLYVVNCFPNFIETMIYREVDALLRAGVDLRVLSLRRPRAQDVPPDAAHLVAKTTYVLPIPPAAFAASHARALLRFGLRYVALLWEVVSGSHGRLSDRRRSFFHFCEAVYVLEKVETAGIEHIHAHWAVGSATCAMVLSRLLGIPYSFTAHAYDVWREQLLLREKVRSARFIATCTEYTRRHLIETYAADPSSIVCIYHGLDLRRFAPRMAPDPEPLEVLAVGRLVEQKGLDTLIRACALLQRRGEEFLCRIVGDGPMRSDLERLARNLDVVDRIRFSGALVGDEVVAAYARAAIFALPCRRAADNDRDGIPNTIIEAMAMELPVVSTSFGAVPEIVAHECNGLLVPVDDDAALADALSRLLHDPRERRRLGGNARCVVEAKFEIDRSAARFLEVLYAERPIHESRGERFVSRGMQVAGAPEEHAGHR